MRHWKKHAALTADSRQTICGLIREPTFLNVPASDGVTCIVCLQGVARAYSEAAHRNLKDAITNRERAEKAEADLATLRADLARVTAERDAAVRTAERIDDKWQVAIEQRDAARAQARELQKLARAAVAWHEADDLTADDQLSDLFAAIATMPPSMLEEPSDG